MSLASGITAAIAVIANAINARNAPGPSDYQMWLAAGNTGTQADYRTAMLGGDVDWAAQFTGALGLPPAAGAATEAQAGVTQFASAAEVLAQASTTKAVSPANLGGVVGHYRVASLAALVALAATAPDGTVATASGVPLGTGLSLDLSSWYKYGGVFYLIGDNYGTGAGAPAALATAVTATSTLRIADRAALIVGAVPYRWKTSGFLPDLQYATAMAFGATNQTIGAALATGLATPTVYSDQTGLLAPKDAGKQNWGLPWLGRYRFTAQLALTATVPAGSYSGITVMDSNARSLGDVGTRALWQAGDVQKFVTDFANPTAGQTAQCQLYAQTTGTFNTTNAGAYTTTDSKNMRVTLEYLGN